MYEKGIKEKLKNGSYRLTEQRTAVLDVMVDSKGQHLTAEEVLYKAREKMPNIGIATVYRTLEKLAELDILYKTMFAEGKYRYELSDVHGHQHHHVICLSCGRIFEVEEDLLNKLEEHLENKGYKIINHELKICGYCPECNKKR